MCYNIFNKSYIIHTFSGVASKKAGEIELIPPAFYYLQIPVRVILIKNIPEFQFILFFSKLHKPCHSICKHIYTVETLWKI